MRPAHSFSSHKGRPGAPLHDCDRDLCMSFLVRGVGTYSVCNEERMCKNQGPLFFLIKMCHANLAWNGRKGRELNLVGGRSKRITVVKVKVWYGYNKMKEYELFNDMDHYFESKFHYS